MLREWGDSQRFGQREDHLAKRNSSKFENQENKSIEKNTIQDIKKPP
jgi:hypothetical protein